jgi:hypothetical protein
VVESHYEPMAETPLAALHRSSKLIHIDRVLREASAVQVHDAKVAAARDVLQERLGDRTLAVMRIRPKTYRLFGDDRGGKHVQPVLYGDLGVRRPKLVDGRSWSSTKSPEDLLHLDADYLKAQAYRLVGQDVLVMDLDAIIQSPVPPPVAGPFSPAYAYPKGRPSDLPYSMSGWPQSYPYLTTCAMVYQTSDCFDLFRGFWHAYAKTTHPHSGYLRGEVATVQTANATRSSVLPEDYLGSTPAHRVLHGH